jgi:hypothetical protein
MPSGSDSTSRGSRMPSALMQVPPAWPRTWTAPDQAGVSGTPTFFVNGRRHYGAYDIAALSLAVRAAGARAALATMTPG